MYFFLNIFICYFHYHHSYYYCVYWHQAKLYSIDKGLKTTVTYRTCPLLHRNYPPGKKKKRPGERLKIISHMPPLTYPSHKSIPRTALKKKKNTEEEESSEASPLMDNPSCDASPSERSAIAMAHRWP